ncbi:putative DNA replication protein dnaD [[Clostridium] ultunense Esp]|uniref:DnaD domain-containing protein n=1 Tax=Thermicanus aegyptius TaxID=94009 RepID=UPI0002B6F299|nr:DnaD domain protein [Thermicanus aegyptius]CCQ97249.1 putative DNA replication protein dnaD [[Clostridium] ultunense Esp]
MDVWIDWLLDGTVSLPKIFFRYAKRMGLNDTQFLILLHIIVFEKEGNSFPTFKELEERMDLPALQVQKEVFQLMKEGFLSLEQGVDPLGKVNERYNLRPLFQKLLRTWEEEQKRTKENLSPANGIDLFSRFEQAFGRPISPMEADLMSQWLDKDHYSHELIIAALEEATLLGIANMKYIDRILFEWTRQGIKNREEAREYALRFREKQYERLQGEKRQRQGAESSSPEIRFPQFNWLNTPSN